MEAAFEAIDRKQHRPLRRPDRCRCSWGSFVAGADMLYVHEMTKAEGELFGKLGNDVFLMIEASRCPSSLLSTASRWAAAMSWP